MRNGRKIEDLLQECLAAYETGLTPEECLSAWPEHRAELEPVFRQALLLRVTYSVAPSPEFSQRARERLLFAAGRDVAAAFATQPEPDPTFRERTRQALLSAAGAAAQEALRDVPPPRLAFWFNARRRLLEAAAAAHQPRPASRPLALTLRPALSAAIVVLAVALGGLVYVASLTPGTPSVNAEIASLEQQVQQVERQTAAGLAVPTDVLLDLSRRTAALAEKVDSTSQAPVAEKVLNLAERQKEVVNTVQAASAAPRPELEQAQQQLQIAEDRVRVAVLSASEPPPPQPTVQTQPAAQEATPTPPPPSPTPQPSGPTPTPVPLTGNQIRITVLTNDNTYGLSWVEVRTRDVRFVVPREWALVGINVNRDGVGTYTSSNLRADAPNGVIAMIGLDDGSIQALIDGAFVLLRGDGPDAYVISLEELVEKAGPSGVAAEFRYMIESMTFLTPPATPTATPTVTPTRTSTPSSSASPTP